MASEPAEGDAALTAAQRARSERNRLRARALQDARVGALGQGAGAGQAPAAKARDTGGGFLLEAEPAAPRLVAAPAPLVHAAQQPHCLACARPFPQSFLFDTFEHPVCDECRDDGDAHKLLTRTEAKAEFLLQDCDLDSRPPPLRCLRRRNPHAPRGEMRLYLRAQLEARAIEAWGSMAELQQERARRAAARLRSKAKLSARRLRALRMDVRGSLYARGHAQHEHAFGEERRVGDEFERECACGHVERYEKL